MTLVVERARDLTLEAVRRVAWGREELAIGEGARQRMEAARMAFHELLEREPELFV